MYLQHSAALPCFRLSLSALYIAYTMDSPLPASNQVLSTLGPAQTDSSRGAAVHRTVQATPMSGSTAVDIDLS